MNPRYTVVIYTPQELSQSSYIQTGLFELENLGVIKLKVKLYLKKNLGLITVNENLEINQTTNAYPKASFYKLINNKTKKSILFAIDLYDFSNKFSKCALENCEYVFKRNYEQKYVSGLPINFQKKVVPISLTFRVLSSWVNFQIQI